MVWLAVPVSVEDAIEARLEEVIELDVAEGLVTMVVNVLPELRKVAVKIGKVRQGSDMVGADVGEWIISILAHRSLVETPGASDRVGGGASDRVELGRVKDHTGLAVRVIHVA